MANSNFGIEPLVGRENWTTWKFAVKTYLQVEDLWQAVEPNKKADGTLEAVDPVKDLKAKGKIVLFLKPENYYHVREAKTAREASLDEAQRRVRGNWPDARSCSALQAHSDRSGILRNYGSLRQQDDFNVPSIERDWISDPGTFRRGSSAGWPTREVSTNGDGSKELGSGYNWRFRQDDFTARRINAK